MRPFKPTYIITSLIKILPYLGITLLMTLSTLIIGTILGGLLARGRIKNNKLNKSLSIIYTFIIRCTPPIVLLFIIYYGLPILFFKVFGVNINNIYKGIFVIISFTLLFSANISEVIRTAFESIDKGQLEAAASAGLTNFQSFYRITLPQAIVIMLPNYGNAVTGLLKEGALAFTIGYVDIMGKGQLIIGKNHGGYALETYIALALIYWLLTIIIDKLFSITGSKMNKKTEIGVS